MITKLIILTFFFLLISCENKEAPTEKEITTRANTQTATTKPDTMEGITKVISEKAQLPEEPTPALAPKPQLATQQPEPSVTNKENEVDEMHSGTSYNSLNPFGARPMGYVFVYNQVYLGIDFIFRIRFKTHFVRIPQGTCYLVNVDYSPFKFKQTFHRRIRSDKDKGNPFGHNPYPEFNTYSFPNGDIVVNDGAIFLNSLAAVAERYGESIAHKCAPDKVQYLE